MKKQLYRVKIKLDEVNNSKSKMVDTFTSSKRNEAKINQSKKVEITAVKSRQMLKDKSILNIIRKWNKRH